MDLKDAPNLLNNVALHNCMNCQKKKCSLIGDLHFDELASLESNRYQAKFKAGELIFKEGTKPSGLMALSEGKVKITRTGELGTELIVALKKPVNFIGFKALMSGEKYVTNAIALEDSEICFIDKNDFFEVQRNNSNLSSKIIQHFAHELNEAQRRTISLTQKHLRGRMAEALLLVDDIYGSSQEDASLGVLLKRADYASLSNMTTANSIRVLSAFSAENVIKLQGRKISILNRNTLLNIRDMG